MHSILSRRLLPRPEVLRVVGGFHRRAAIATAWLMLAAVAAAALPVERLHENTRALLANPTDAATLASERRALLNELARTDPAAAIHAALRIEEHEKLPATIRAACETPVSTLGDLEVLCALPPAGAAAAPNIRRVVTIDGVRYPAVVYGRRVFETSKRRIPLRGVLVDGTFILADTVIEELPGAGGPGVVGRVAGRFYPFSSRESLREAEARLAAAEAAPDPNSGAAWQSALSSATTAAAEFDWSTGPKRVLVVRLGFPDRPGSVVTAADAQALMDEKITPFYAASSAGLTSISTTVTTKVYQLANPLASYPDDSGPDAIRIEAEKLIKADYPDSYDRYVYVTMTLPHVDTVTPFSGLAVVGGRDIWINGEYSFRVLSHELGHTYGVLHANSWLVSDGDPISAAGKHQEYGDLFDCMGSSNMGGSTVDFSPQMKSIFGWLPAGAVRTVTAGGVYRLRRFDLRAPGAGEVLALRCAKDADHSYVISYRGGWKPSYSSKPVVNITEGAYLIRTQSKQGLATELLDCHPETASVQDAGLLPGESFVDPALGLEVRPLRIGGSGADQYLDVELVLSDPQKLPQVDVGASRFGVPTTIRTHVPAAPIRTELYVDGALWQESAAADAVFSWDPPAPGVHHLSVRACYADGTFAVRNLVVSTALPEAWVWGAPAVQGNVIRGLARAFNRWWAVGDRGALVSSADGSAWRVERFPTSANLRSIATDGRQLIVATDKTDPTNGQYAPSLWASTDGATWSSAMVNAPFGSAQSVAYQQGTWAAAVDTWRIATSKDGRTWSAAVRPPTKTPMTGFTLHPGGGRWMAISDSGEVFATTDFATWATCAPLPAQFVHVIHGIAWNGTAWLVNAQTSVGEKNFVSTDLTSWRTGDWSSWAYAVQSFDGQFVVCTADAIHTSPDGITWSALSRPNSRLTAIAAADGVWVAAGAGGRIYRGTLLNSLATSDNALRPNLTGLVVRPDGVPLFSTAVSLDSASPSGIVAVQNGTLVASQCPAANLNGIAVRGSIYVAIATDGAAYRSLDGTAWTRQVVAKSQYLRDVVATAREFIAVAESGAMYASTDGITWTPRTSGTPFPIFSIATNPGGNRIVALAADRSSYGSSTVMDALSSEDGVTWQRVSLGVSGIGAKPVWQPGLGFCTVVEDKLLASADGRTWTQLVETEVSYQAIAASPYGLLLGGSGMIAITPDGRNLSIAAAPGSISRLWYANDTLYASATGLLMLPLTRSAIRAAAFAQQPASQSVALDHALSLAADVSGSGPFQFQWCRAGTPIPGATHSTYTVEAATSGDAGNYTVVVRGAGGAATSTPAQVVVTEGPLRISVAPSSQEAALGSPVRFAVGASAPGAIAYQWYHNGAALAGATSASLDLPAITAQSYGSYSVRVSAGNDAITRMVTLAPSARVQRVAPTLVLPPGGTYAFSVAEPSPSLGYQWYQDGVVLPGEVGPTLVGHAASSGSCALTVRVSANGMVTQATPVTVAVGTSDATRVGRLCNVSVLTRSGSGESALTVGVVSRGDVPVLVRAVGPTLTRWGVGGVMADPQLTLYTGGAAVRTNDNWGGDPILLNTMASVGAFPLPADSTDAAVVTRINGAYTAQVKAQNEDAGQALVEMYDTSPLGTSAARVANLSCRTVVGPGDRTVTVGFVIGGDSARTVLIRGIGPTLTKYGVGGVLPDPKLTLYAGSDPLATNDDWEGAVPDTVFAASGAFPLTSSASRDAAIIITLPPGLYTVQIAPSDQSAGIALSELYELP